MPGRRMALHRWQRHQVLPRLEPRDGNLARSPDRSLRSYLVMFAPTLVPRVLRPPVERPLPRGATNSAATASYPFDRSVDHCGWAQDLSLPNRPAPLDVRNGSEESLIALQCFEKRDERLFVFGRQLQPEFVAPDRAGSAMVTFRYIVLLQTGRVEPFLQGVRTSSVAKTVAKPDAAKRRHFIKSGPAASLGRQHRVGSHRDIQD